MRTDMPIIIKRYRNRKLYNTQSKRYITLDEIEQIIKQQQEITVIDNDTGNDITATTLSQIIFELEKNQTGVLPVNLLFSLAQSGGKRIDEIRRNIFTSLNFAHHFEIEIDRRVRILIENGELSQQEGNQFLDKMLSIGFKQEKFIENVEEKIVEFLKDRDIPTRDDYITLIDRIDTLSKKMDGLNIDWEMTKRDPDQDQIIE
jgi:polyhydroxyalkanoate synthesis repressor PhaR